MRDSGYLEEGCWFEWDRSGERDKELQGAHLKLDTAGNIISYSYSHLRLEPVCPEVDERYANV